MANIILQTDDISPMMSILLHALAPLYAPSDHIKYRCLNTRGIVSVVVHEEGMVLTFVTQDTHKEVHMISLTQDIYGIQFLRSLHTLMLWSHAPPQTTFIDSHWGCGSTSVALPTEIDPSVTAISQEWRVVMLLS